MATAYTRLEIDKDDSMERPLKRTRTEPPEDMLHSTSGVAESAEQVAKQEARNGSIDVDEEDEQEQGVMVNSRQAPRASDLYLDTVCHYLQTNDGILNDVY